MYYDSVFLNFLYIIIKKIRDFYYNSFISRIADKIGRFFKKLFSGSAVWNFIKRDDYFSKTWTESVFYKAMNLVINGFVVLGSKICLRFENLFGASLILRLVKYLTGKFQILIGSFLLLMVIIKHESWHDQYSSIVILALTVLYFIGICLRNERFKISNIDFVLAIFMVMVIIAEVFSISPSQSLKGFIFYVTCFLIVLLIISSVKTPSDLNLLIGLMLVGVTITGLFSVWQYVTNSVKVSLEYTDITMSYGLRRMPSTFFNPNNYAIFLIITLPFFFSSVLNAKTLLRKLLFIAMAVPPVIALFLTGTRAAWLALVFSIFIIILFKNRKLIPVFILLGIACFPLLPAQITDRIMTLTNFSADKSSQYRLLIYKSVTPIISDFWLTGGGLGNEVFARLFNRYYKFTGTGVIAHAHNVYLELWIQMGIFGLLSFVWFMLRMIKKSIKAIFGEADKMLKNILVAGVAGIAGALLIGFVEYIWFYPRVMIIFWAVVGIILAALGMLKTHKETKVE